MTISLSHVRVEILGSVSDYTSKEPIRIPYRLVYAVKNLR